MLDPPTQSLNGCFKYYVEQCFIVTTVTIVSALPVKVRVVLILIALGKTRICMHHFIVYK